METGGLGKSAEQGSVHSKRRIDYFSSVFALSLLVT
jgi:hypothetical protein